jgi:hypothetical protein
MGMAASGTADTFFDFVSENLKLTQELPDLSGFRGLRGRPSERVREVARRVGGPIVFHPTPGDLVTLLPRILGAAAVGTTFAVAETIPSFIVTIDRVIKVPTYTGCYVNRATFRGSENSPMELTLDIIGTDESVGAAGSFPAISVSDATVPYVFSDLALVINSVTYACKTWELTVDNALEPQFFNSLTMTRANATDRIITVTTQLPYGDASAAYGLTQTGVACTATFTNGGVSCLFTTPAVSFPKDSPVVSNTRGEIFLNLTGVARRSGSTAELTITNDSTP